MEFEGKPPVGPAAAAVARAANLSGLLQALAVGAMPRDTVEGLLVAAETAIAVQRITGLLDEQEADALRRRIAEWGRCMVEDMERDGTAEKIREQHRERMEECVGAKGVGGSGPN